MSALTAEVIPLRPTLMTIPTQPSPAEQEIAIPYWPKLAKAIGRDEQLFLAQLDYWISKSSNERDGRRWVYNTVDAWADQFCDMSRSAIGRTIKSLKEKGLIESTSSYNTRYGDRTQWYAINYDHPTLAPFLHLLKSKNPATMPYPTNGISDIPEMGHTYPTNGISDVPKSGFVKGTGDYVQEITQENIPPTPQNRAARTQPGGAVQYTKDFERVYALIPKRDKKLQAFRVWEAIKPDAALAEQIARAMQQQVQANPRWREEGARYCPALDIWLTNRRWEDTPPVDAKPVDEEPELLKRGPGRMLAQERKYEAEKHKYTLDDMTRERSAQRIAEIDAKLDRMGVTVQEAEAWAQRH
mgnify:CR=1 FL=1